MCLIQNGGALPRNKNSVGGLDLGAKPWAPESQKVAAASRPADKIVDNKKCRDTDDAAGAPST